MWLSRSCSVSCRKGGTGSTADGSANGTPEQDAGPPAPVGDAKPPEGSEGGLPNGTAAVAEVGPGPGPLPAEVGSGRDAEQGQDAGPQGTPVGDGVPNAPAEPMEED